MKKILCFVLAILCLLAVAGCGGGAKKAEVPAQKQAAAEKVLRVGTDADYPPFEYYQESTKAFIGFDVELVQGVAREMGYSRVEFVDLEFNNLLPSLKDGQVDAVISCMNITEERKKAAEFHGALSCQFQRSDWSRGRETRQRGRHEGQTYCGRDWQYPRETG